LGGAVIKKPSSGWDSDDLASIFSQTVARDTYDPNASPDNQPSPNRRPSPKKRLSVGAIAGIVVGVVVIVAGIFAAVFWTRKRRSSRGTGATGIALTPSGKEWNKPELDASVEASRYELDHEARVHEVEGKSLVSDHIGQQQQQQQQQQPLLWELPASSSPR